MNPLNDGVDHINVYSKGRTALGRLLTNFAYSPFVHPEDGKFTSVEGYWYWLSTKDDALRGLHGFHAKKRGREIGGKDWLEDDVFKTKIKEAIKCKLDQNPKIKALLLASSLPLTHYYVFGNLDKPKVVNVPEGQWILDCIEQYRGSV